MGEVKNNYSRLKEEADIKMVVESLGLAYQKKGSCYFLSCPNPEHNDSNPSAYFKSGWNNIICMSCGKSTNAIDLIQYTNHCDFGEAADYLWDLEGCPDWYYADWKEKNTNKKKNFSLTHKECEILGIHLPSTVESVKNCADIKPELKKNESFVGKDISFYVVADRLHFRYEDFCTPDQFVAIVNNIVVEKINSLCMQFEMCNIILSICNDTNTRLLRETILYTLNECYNIREKIKEYNAPPRKRRARN